MSGAEPGSMSETHNGMPSGTARKWMSPPKSLCFWLNHHQSLPYPPGDAVTLDQRTVLRSAVCDKRWLRLPALSPALDARGR